MVVASGPHHLYVNGERLSSYRVNTGADCAQAAGISLQPGHLRDARGKVLVVRGGQCGLILRNGQPMAPDSPVQGGDIIAVIPGGDKVEPIIEKVSSVPAHAVDGRSNSLPLPRNLSNFHGLRRARRGKITGLVGTLEVAQVIPVVQNRSQPAASGMVVLTFDDGPLPQYTPQILDILAAHRARATFFVIGYLAQRYPDLVRRAAREGHEIGIHSWAHPDFTELSTGAIEQDMHRCHQLLRPLTEGYAPVRWFRPPYGAKNARVEAAIHAAGCRIAMWSVDPSDWRHPGSEVICKRILSRVHDGAVILLHDGGGPRQGTVNAVRRLVPALQQRGYQLVTMSELSGLEPIFRGEVIVATAGDTIRLMPAAEKLAVVIDGEPVELSAPPLEAEGQLLVPLEPIVALLGASYQWDKERQMVHISGLAGHLLLRLDSRQAEKNGQAVTLRVPPVLYQNTPMIPLWALVNITGAQARYDSQHFMLRLTSPLGGDTGLIPYSHWAGREMDLGWRPTAAQP